MLIVKLFLVALSLYVQDKAFPSHEAPESGLDTLALPEENPETALARRAMEAEGLCPAAIAGAEGVPAGAYAAGEEADPAAEPGEPRGGYLPDPVFDLASACD